MLHVEESRLIQSVDLETRQKFLSKQSQKEIGDTAVGFEHVAGLDEHITSLKEMVGLPLMYPDIFSRFNINPPRGK